MLTIIKVVRPTRKKPDLLLLRVKLTKAIRQVLAGQDWFKYDGRRTSFDVGENHVSAELGIFREDIQGISGIKHLRDLYDALTKAGWSIVVTNRVSVYDEPMAAESAGKD